MSNPDTIITDPQKISEFTKLGLHLTYTAWARKGTCPPIPSWKRQNWAIRCCVSALPNKLPYRDVKAGGKLVIDCN